MPTREVEIINKLGMHARAAAKFVNLASSYAAELEVEKGTRRVNGKSIMGIMMLAASRGTTVRLIAEGEDAQDALDALEGLIGERFGEPE
ncbi:MULTISPECIES: HPr family phosphocarrier protein [unclassified Ectothiorhodospira]|jgi:phosphocarrier protein|uniref:HPr family phosphocarrier protein n=1 Tax=unclassified Ectothiorhodospira TaxID=2684909 RepID=UPI001EE82B1C|nr:MULTISPECIES: HPr family phosphocarrier protein [unclassified Ectothiorhodospira]MCG5515122.1 HPr family phosphocarrier protein [Ectothiorhodospira sp. 9100]MCG5517839.1 HPr family phosphocarrier protein [Ectothiorhodospira sp. 9905]